MRTNDRVDEDVLEQIARESASECAMLFPAELAKIDAAVEAFFALFFVFIEQWKDGCPNLIWPDISFKRMNPNLMFASLLSSAINSLVAVRRLAMIGLDKQARSVFRELIETTDFIIAFIGNRNFVQRFLDSPEENHQALAYWKKHFRPAEIHQILKFTEQEIAQPEDELLSKLTETLYPKLSKSAHVDLVGLLMGGISGDTKDVYNFNIGGRIGPHTEGTLTDLCVYLRLTLNLILNVLAKKHDWSTFDMRYTGAIDATRHAINLGPKD